MLLSASPDVKSNASRRDWWFAREKAPRCRSFPQQATARASSALFLTLDRCILWWMAGCPPAKSRLQARLQRSASRPCRRSRVPNLPGEISRGGDRALQGSGHQGRFPRVSARFGGVTRWFCARFWMAIGCITRDETAGSSVPESKASGLECAHITAGS